MKATIRISSYLIIILITFSCLPFKRQSDAGNLMVPLSDTVTLADGALVYGLPRTVFTIFVEMERTIERPGPYARYAGDLLGLNNAIQNEGEYWSVERVTVKTHEELDPSEYYVIKSNNIFLTNVLSLKKEGLILDLNPAIYYNAESQTVTGEQGNNLINSFDLGSDEYFQTQRDTAYKRVNMDSLFIRIPYIVEKKKKLTVDQLAERAARNLMEMREGKHLILTGEANVFPQSDAAINEINRVEKAYTELFVGKTLRETRTFSYQIIPKKEMVGKPVILFRFSEMTGPVSGSLEGGIAVTAELIPEQKTKSIAIFNNQPITPAGAKYDKLFYRVPDVVNLKISMGPEILFSSRRLVYQFGEVVQLPANYIIGK